ANMYLKINVAADPTYYTNNQNFDFDIEAAKNLLDSVSINNPYSQQEIPEVPTWQYNEKYGQNLTLEEVNESIRFVGGENNLISESFYTELPKIIKKLTVKQLENILSARFQYKYGVNFEGDWRKR